MHVIGASHKLLRSHSHPPFLKVASGARITDVRRRAKNVIVDLDNRHSVLIHMRMSGHLLVTSDSRHMTREGRWENVPKSDPLADPKNQFIRIVFELSGGMLLALSDVRKFATIDLFKTDALAHYLDEKYGPEPFEKTFTLDWFSRELKRRNRVIKPLLMDQAFIAGVGNIYADESLWKAKIHPLTRSDALPSEDVQALYDAIRTVLRTAIDLGGTSDDDYRNVAGEKGKYGLSRMAYRRAGEKCARCNTTMQRLVVGQRGTTICPQCQKKI